MYVKQWFVVLRVSVESVPTLHFSYFLLTWLLLFIQKLIVTKEQIAEVERLTRGQAANPLWASLRSGRLTASKFGSVLRAIRQKSYTPSLFKSLLQMYDLSNKQAVQWGNEHEKIAADAYAAENCPIAECGAFVHQSGVLLASPDRLEGEDGILEIKCPFVYRDCTIADALNDPKLFIGIDKNGEIALKNNHVYYDQCQGQLQMTGRAYVSFFVWLPKGSLRVFVNRDDTWGKRTFQICWNSIIQFFLPNYIEHHNWEHWCYNYVDNNVNTNVNKVYMIQ